MPKLPIKLGGTGVSSLAPDTILKVSSDGTKFEALTGDEGMVLSIVNGVPKFINITVSAPANQSPVVSAGDSQGITLPTSSVTLTAIANDADGTIASYQWTQILGPNTATITSPTSASTTVTGLIAGVYSFRIQVVDNEGATANASTQVSVSAQSTTQFTTTINSWNAAVKLPPTYYTDANTVKYSLILFFPGLGQVGTNVSDLLLYGPNHFINTGAWNGSTVVNGVTKYPIIISLQPPTAYPTESLIATRLATILSTWRVDTNSINITGPSQGGWICKTFVTGDSYGGPYNYAGQITSLVDVQGVKSDDNSPYPNLFDNYALSGGKYVGFEQALDNRDIQTVVNRMNAAVANSAIYIGTNFCDTNGQNCGIHGYFNSVYDPAATFNIGGVTQNIYQWMLKQAKTTVVPNQSAAFNFNATAQSVSGWNDVTGQPHLAVVSVTDSLTGSGITVSSIATTKWGASGGNTAVSSGGESASTGTFPFNVQTQYWFSFNLPYSTNGDNLKISGLTVGAKYKIEVLGSRISTAVSQTDRQTAYYVHEIDTTQSVENFNVKGNVTPYTFNDCDPNLSGEIYLGISMPPTGNSTNGYQYGYLNGLRITRTA